MQNKANISENMLISISFKNTNTNSYISDKYHEVTNLF